MDDKEYALKKADGERATLTVWLTALGVMSAIVGLALTAHSAVVTSRLEANKQLNDARLNACLKLSRDVAALYAAEDEKSFNAAALGFAETKHSDALLLLDQKVLSAAIALDKKVTEFHAPKAKGSDFRVAVQGAICNEPFALVELCRAEVAEDFTKEAGDSKFVALPSAEMFYDFTGYPQGKTCGTPAPAQRLARAPG